MTELQQAPRARLYVLFEGQRGDRRPVSARPRAPRSGIKVRVAVEQTALETARVFLLYRRGDGDLVLGASSSRTVLEQMRERPGRKAGAWEIGEIPVLKPKLPG